MRFDLKGHLSSHKVLFIFENIFFSDLSSLKFDLIETYEFRHSSKVCECYFLFSKFHLLLDLSFFFNFKSDFTFSNNNYTIFTLKFCVLQCCYYLLLVPLIISKPKLGQKLYDEQEHSYM